MNKHRYQFVYLPLQRRIGSLSGRGQRLVFLGKALVITGLVVLALMRTNQI